MKNAIPHYLTIPFTLSVQGHRKCAHKWNMAGVEMMAVRHNGYIWSGVGMLMLPVNELESQNAASSQ